jgi:uncharacterized membrane protein YeiH
LLILTYIAVTASTISGVLEARKHSMDIVGATTIAFVTAFGGGTIRDLLLGRTPVFWLVDPWLSIVTFVIAIISFYWLDNISNKFMVIADAIGLGLFSILGATYALQLEISPIIAVLMGVVTGIFGGVLRDLLCNRNWHMDFYYSHLAKSKFAYCLCNWRHYNFHFKARCGSLQNDSPLAITSLSLSHCGL